MVTLIDVRLELNAKYLLDWLWLFLLAAQLRQRIESTKLGEICFVLLDLSPQEG